MKKKIIIICLLVAVFAVGVYFGATDAYIKYENTVFEWLNPNNESNGFMKFMTDVGEASSIIAIIVVLLLIPQTRLTVGLPSGLIALFSRIVNTVIKSLVARERPVDKLLVVGEYSFPSGHSMNGAAFYLGLMLLILRICKTKQEKTFVCVLLIFITFTIGVSRLYFKVHYISDVLSGWSLGIVIAILGNELYGYILNRSKNGTGKIEV